MGRRRPMFLPPCPRPAPAQRRGLPLSYDDKREDPWPDVDPDDPVVKGPWLPLARR